ncbi:hypothetical protein [Paracoccus seriniphilus]|uniref:Uncharacterized protein n=1 Tax=Paracoccus seriniphilus TaxID=184748 RepID=A0A239PMU0_9RHOB|nr:hypothetical protein [Paracoccus seriniphilus]WCR14952.1 hypothetical protein JHW44_05870 [Paracoccus seriniphilus]SNT71619.1 hypothetical protein SAMN05444959_102128 [Paracoccus seriniphilus]
MPTIEQTIYVTKEMLGYIGNQPTNPPGINPGDEGFGLYAPDPHQGRSIGGGNP